MSAITRKLAFDRRHVSAVLSVHCQFPLFRTCRSEAGMWNEDPFFREDLCLSHRGIVMADHDPSSPTQRQYQPDECGRLEHVGLQEDIIPDPGN